MANPLTKPAVTQEKTDLHRFELVAGGKVLSSARLLAVSIAAKVNRIPTAIIHLLDGDVATQTFEQSMLPALALGKTLTIAAGYGNALDPIFEGEVVGHSIKSRGSQSSVLVLELQHKAIRMARGRRSQLYLDMTDPQIAAQLGERNGGMQIDWEGVPGQPAEKTTQFNVSDWDFLVSRAEARGRVVVVEGDRIKVIAPVATGSAKQTFTFGKDIYDFEAGQDSRYAYRRVTANSWDYELQASKAIRSTGEPKQDNGDEHALHYTGHLPNEGWQEWVDGVQQRMELSRLRGHFVIKGNAALAIGDWVDLKGFGAQFEQQVFVAGLSHKMDGGDWRTDVEVGLQPETFAKYHDVLDEPIAGLIPAIRGLVIGVVKGLDDRQGHHRIELLIPSIDAERHVMARLAQPEAGNGRGAFFFPQIGDEVVVGFLEEDPNNPIVLGSLYSAKQPPPFEGNAKGAQAHLHRGLFSPEKLKVELDDAQKAIMIETPEGLRISLSKETIKLERGNDLIEMKPGTCTIDIQGDLVIKANQVKVEGKAVVDLSAPQVKLSDSAQGKLALQGGIANLDGSAIFIG